MSSATSVLTAFLENRADARRALGVLTTSLQSEGIEVIEAAIVTLKSNNVVQLDISPEPFEHPAASDDHVIERLFPERIRSLPAVGREADSAAAYYAEIGLEANLLKELGENLAPTSAALVAVVGERWVDQAERALGTPSVRRFPLDLHQPVGEST